MEAPLMISRLATPLHGMKTLSGFTDHGRPDLFSYVGERIHSAEMQDGYQHATESGL